MQIFAGGKTDIWGGLQFPFFGSGFKLHQVLFLVQIRSHGCFLLFVMHAPQICRIYVIHNINYAHN